MSMGDVPRGFRDGRLVLGGSESCEAGKRSVVLYDFRAYER